MTVKYKAAASNQIPDDPIINRISIAECRKILKDNNLTDEQVLVIRDFLYQVAEIDYRYQEQQSTSQTIIVPLITNNYDEQESNSIHTRKYRRAS